MTTTPPFGRRGLSPLSADPAPRYNNILPNRGPELSSNSFDLVQLFFGFDGRISRLQFWLGRISIIITTAVMMLIEHYMKSGVGNVLLERIFVAIVAVLVLWASFAVELKRWHDRGKSWVWLLLVLVPIAGPLWAFIELGCRVGTLGPNAHGPAPMGVSGGIYADFADVFS